MFHMPMFSQSGDHTLTIDRFVTSSAHRNAHFVMTTKTIEFSLQFTTILTQLDSAATAIEMVRMEEFALKAQRIRFIDDLMASLTHVLSDGVRLLLSIAGVTQSSICIANESLIGKRVIAHVAGETLRMPAAVQSSNHSTNDEFAAFRTTRSVQYVKVPFAILSTFKLVKDSLRSERSETLSAHETIVVPNLTS